MWYAVWAKTPYHTGKDGPWEPRSEMDSSSIELRRVPYNRSCGVPWGAGLFFLFSFIFFYFFLLFFFHFIFYFLFSLFSFFLFLVFFLIYFYFYFVFLFLSLCYFLFPVFLYFSFWISISFPWIFPPEWIFVLPEWIFVLPQWKIFISNYFIYVSECLSPREYLFHINKNLFLFHINKNLFSTSKKNYRSLKIISFDWFNALWFIFLYIFVVLFQIFTFPFCKYLFLQYSVGEFRRNLTPSKRRICRISWNKFTSNVRKWQSNLASSRESIVRFRVVESAKIWNHEPTKPWNRESVKNRSRECRCGIWSRH
jgi:hypothetical protein